jgi:hypothetical protein
VAVNVACASVGGRFLTFAIGELKTMEKGGRGLMLIDLEPKDSLAGAAAYSRSVRIDGIGRGVRRGRKSWKFAVSIMQRRHALRRAKWPIWALSPVVLFAWSKREKGRVAKAIHPCLHD